MNCLHYMTNGAKIYIKEMRIMELFSEELKKVLLAGIGAVALTAEKSKDVVEQLVKKGELTIEQGKILNEELKHTVKDKLRTPEDVEKMSKDIEKLNAEDLAKLKAKIEELEKEGCHEE